MRSGAINFGAEVRILESSSVRCGDFARSIDTDAAENRITPKSGEGDDHRVCGEAACEAELVATARSGDQHAFLELCRRHRPSLKRRIRGIVRNCEDVEDVLQETLMSAFRHLAGFRAKCSFRTWILTIATNQSLMLLRKRRNHPETGFGIVTAEGKEIEILQISDPMPNPEQAYANRQVSQSLSQAVRMLPPGFRQLVERYHRDEVKLADAANAMGITAAAAKSRLLRARIALRRHLNNGKSQYLD
jgi:RNA polymerase sigma factor (sigma-70 family)